MCTLGSYWPCLTPGFLSISMCENEASGMAGALHSFKLVTWGVKYDS
jgi:hypothetical protein